jgi:copper chaperone CopZ
MIKQTFRVTGMHCPNCAMNLEILEDKLPGVKQISASYKKAQMVVEYDEKQLDVAGIVAAVSQKGYQAELVK